MRSQGLPLNTIVLGAVAVLVLVVIAVAVVPAMGGLFDATSGSGDVTDIDTCEHNCRMMKLFAQYAYQAGPNSQYCADGCLGPPVVAECVIRGETVSTANCLGQCDSAGDCPPDTCTTSKDCTSLCVGGFCGYPTCAAGSCNCDLTGNCESTTCPC